MIVILKYYLLKQPEFLGEMCSSLGQETNSWAGNILSYQLPRKQPKTTSSSKTWKGKGEIKNQQPQEKPTNEH